MDYLQTALTAVHCARSLILSSGKGNGALQYCVGQLLPGLIEALAEIAELNPRPEHRVVCAQEILKVLLSFFSIVPIAFRKLLSDFSITFFYTVTDRAALDILLPTVSLLLEPNTVPAPPTHSFAIQSLIQLASQDSNAFKQSTAELDPVQRSLLETCIRQSVGTTQPTSLVPAKPTIDLKLSF